MYDTILVPLDGSTFSEHALGLASVVADRTGAGLRLVLVHTPVVPLTTDLAPVAYMDQWEGQHRERERQYLEGVADRLREQGLEVGVEVRGGEVVRVLTDLADTSDLVVLATHGRGGLARAWLGSVADALIRHATTPILLVRPPEEAEESDAPPPTAAPAPGHVLAATDGSAPAAAAVEQAAGLARLFGARLTLIQVVTFPGGLSSPYIPHAAEMDRVAAEEGREAAEEALAELAARFDDLDVRTRVERAFHPARGILAAVEDSDVDLLVLGSRHKTALGRAVMGSTSDKVVRASPVPVLVAHAE